MSWGSGVLELCGRAGSRERAECSACQHIDCLIKPMRTSPHSRGPGARASFFLRRNHAANMISIQLSIQLQRSVSRRA